MIRKIFLLSLLFILLIIPSQVSAATSWCCGSPDEGGSKADPKMCFDSGETTNCRTMGPAKNLRSCNPANIKIGDVDGNGTDEEYSTDCYVLIKAPGEVKITDFGKLFTGAVAFLLLIAFILAFFFLILGGISWLTSGGDKAAVETARNKIIAAIIGLIIVAATWAIFQLVGGAIGFNILQGFTIPRLF